MHTGETHALLAGSSPLIISVPHSGTALPEELVPQLTPKALSMPDTDWHVDRLYDFAPALGATVLIARQSRYVIDLNRPPDDAALYSAAPKTGLCPSHTFAGEPLYAQTERNAEISVSSPEIARRKQLYWNPYHDALQAQLNAVRARHGFAVLLDAHSIRSIVPQLFDGRLPDINVGTFNGKSCSSALIEAVRKQLDGNTRWSHVFDGRFKGGHITRHYGEPGTGVHALQIEIAQAAYMDESATIYDTERARPLQKILVTLVETLQALRL